MTFIIIISAIFILIAGVILNISGMTGGPLLFLSTILLSKINLFNDITKFIFILLFLFVLLSEIIDFFAAPIAIKFSNAGKKTLKITIIFTFIFAIISIITFQFYFIIIGTILGIVIGEYLSYKKINIINNIKVIFSIFLTKTISYIIKIFITLLFIGINLYQLIHYII